MTFETFNNRYNRHIAERIAMAKEQLRRSESFNAGFMWVVCMLTGVCFFAAMWEDSSPEGILRALGLLALLVIGDLVCLLAGKLEQRNIRRTIERLRSEYR